jgi:hypothetical protein
MSRRKSFEQFEHMTAPDAGYYCYLYHFDPPYIPEGAEDDPRLWAGHYLGSAPDLNHRDSQQGGPDGARLLQIQKEAGGSWHLTRTWVGDRIKEFQLKTRASKAYCPECTDHPMPGTSPPREGARYLSRKQRRERQAVREAGAQQARTDETLRIVREVREAGLNGSANREPGLSYGEAHKMLAPDIGRAEPEPPDALQRIEALEATWRRAPRQRTPDMELEAGLYERRGRRTV